MSPSLRPFVAPVTPPEELDRRFVSTLVAVEKVRRRRQAARVLIPALAVAALVLMALRFDRAPRSGLANAPAPYAERAGSGLGSGAAAPAVLVAGEHALGDGSVVQVQAASALAVGELGPTTHRLLRGAAVFRVAPQKSGEFVVLADEVKVRVVGTVFSVNLVEGAGGVRVSVDVREGTVIVESGDAVRRLTAGQHWEGNARSAERGDPTRAKSLPPPAVIGARTGEGPARDARRPTRSAPTPNANEVKETFALAVAARGRGDRATAIGLFRQVSVDDPRGSFGQLAALELGRLELGSEGDPGRASQYLEQALQSGDKSPLRAENLARLVEAYGRQGDLAKCRAARGQFAREFPTSPLAPQVAARCR